MSELKIKNQIMVSRGVEAQLDHITSYMYQHAVYKGDSNPSLPLDDAEAAYEWNEGNTWYPFAEEYSDRKIPENIIEEAIRVAVFASRWIALRAYYINPKNRKGYYMIYYFPPNRVLKPFVSRKESASK